MRNVSRSRASRSVPIDHCADSMQGTQMRHAALLAREGPILQLPPVRAKLADTFRGNEVVNVGRETVVKVDELTGKTEHAMELNVHCAHQHLQTTRTH